MAGEAHQSEASDDELEDPTSPATTSTLKAPVCIVWDKYPERTEHLLDYLNAHPDVTLKLFGDSTQAARLEGRTKLTAKSNKGTAYLQVADGIFSVDNDPAVRADFATNPSKYAKAADNYITNTQVLSYAFSILLSNFIRLKKQYHAANERIGRTGAGLKAEDITPGIKIANIIGK